MDNQRMGALLRTLRKERGKTQAEIANQLSISHKTVSKWERGKGYPDVSLLKELSNLYGINIEKILSGSLDEKFYDGGNMKRIAFYACPHCHNVITGSSPAEVSCCGRKLEVLQEQTGTHPYETKVQDLQHEHYIQIDHPMTKDHFISFVSFVGFDQVLTKKLYPEQNAELHLPKMQKGRLYAHCTQKGLWSIEL